MATGRPHNNIVYAYLDSSKPITYFITKITDCKIGTKSLPESKAPFTPESYAGVTPKTSEHFWCESANPAQILPPSRSS